jgi:hypothetical protein
MNASDFDAIRALSFTIGFTFTVIGGGFWNTAHNQLKRIKKLGNEYNDNLYYVDGDKDKQRLRDWRAWSRQRKFFKAMCFIGLFIFMFGWVFLTYLRAHFYI